MEWEKKIRCEVKDFIEENEERKKRKKTRDESFGWFFWKNKSISINSFFLHITLSYKDLCKTIANRQNACLLACLMKNSLFLHVKYQGQRFEIFFSSLFYMVISEQATSDMINFLKCDFIHNHLEIPYVALINVSQPRRIKRAREREKEGGKHIKFYII